ncbi:MAG: 16S rRNA (cytosine(1402)-N(4))-methyltransferase RsmH [Candidatus Caenarcaniphilales bacterium]|nr:16S rRNA (cytosine(1402)-N(4))-methyltransferase RsmH [Candidatus Caenarcaniphilales bacterium]
MSSSYSHIAVMPTETLSELNVQEGLVYFDCTLGAAGHSKMILEKLNTTGHLYSFDQDINVIKQHQAEADKYENWTLVHSNFENIPNYCKENNIKITGGLLMDLGLSSIQLDDPERGFSYQHDTKLDMRMDTDLEISAYEVINHYKEKEIADMFYNYAEERLSRQIASKIIESRPIETSQELADLIKDIYWRRYHKKSKTHPATKCFQALRIYVNRELEVLKSLLDSIPEILEKEARVVIISFHSLEDRIAKLFFKKKDDNYKFELPFKKPLEATREEYKENSRSRCAKLRAGIFRSKENQCQ